MSARKLFSHIGHIAVLFVLVLPLRQELVLCVEADGHSEVELVRDGKCLSCVGEDTHPEPTLTEVHSDDCGACVDFPLPASELQVQQKKEVTGEIALVASPFVHKIQTLFVHRPPVVTRVIEAAPPSRFLAAIKTIVLLI